MNLKNATKRKKKADKLAKEEKKITKNGRLNVTKIEKKSNSEELPKKKFENDVNSEKISKFFKMKKKWKK